MSSSTLTSNSTPVPDPFVSNRRGPSESLSHSSFSISLREETENYDKTFTELTTQTEEEEEQHYQHHQYQHSQNGENDEEGEIEKAPRAKDSTYSRRAEIDETVEIPIRALTHDRIATPEPIDGEEEAEEEGDEDEEEDEDEEDDDEEEGDDGEGHDSEESDPDEVLDEAAQKRHQHLQLQVLQIQQQQMHHQQQQMQMGIEPYKLAVRQSLQHVGISSSHASVYTNPQLQSSPTSSSSSTNASPFGLPPSSSASTTSTQTSHTGVPAVNYSPAYSTQPYPNDRISNVSVFSHASANAPESSSSSLEPLPSSSSTASNGSPPIAASGSSVSVASTVSFSSSPSLSSKPLANWQLHPGKNRFFCNGRIMFGPGVRAFFITYSLILFPSLLFLLFPAADLASRSPSLSVPSSVIPLISTFLLLMSLIFLKFTALVDPGILPRRAKQEDIDAAAYENPFRMKPRVQDMIVNGKPTQIRYCTTCHIYRPPRTVHCNLCMNCVEMFDHHCPWIGTCIGKRNYRSFSIFLYSLSLHLLLVLSLCIVHMYVIAMEYETPPPSSPTSSSAPSDSVASTPIQAFTATLHRNPISFILSIYCFLGMFFVVGLCSFHVYLVCSGLTTNEQLKHTFPHGSPHSNGVAKNFLGLFCSTQIKPHIQMREISTLHTAGAVAVSIPPSVSSSPGSFSVDPSQNGQIHPAPATLSLTPAYTSESSVSSVVRAMAHRILPSKLLPHSHSISVNANSTNSVFASSVLPASYLTKRAPNSTRGSLSIVRRIRFVDVEEMMRLDVEARKRKKAREDASKRGQVEREQSERERAESVTSDSEQFSTIESRAIGGGSVTMMGGVTTAATMAMSGPVTAAGVGVAMSSNKLNTPSGPRVSSVPSSPISLHSSPHFSSQIAALNLSSRSSRNSRTAIPVAFFPHPNLSNNPAAQDESNGNDIEAKLHKGRTSSTSSISVNCAAELPIESSTGSADSAGAPQAATANPSSTHTNNTNQTSIGRSAIAVTSISSTHSSFHPSQSSPKSRSQTPAAAPPTISSNSTPPLPSVRPHSSISSSSRFNSVVGHVFAAVRGNVNINSATSSPTHRKMGSFDADGLKHITLQEEETDDNDNGNDKSEQGQVQLEMEQTRSSTNNANNT